MQTADKLTPYSKNFNRQLHNRANFHKMFKKFIVLCSGLASLIIITTVAAYFWFVVYQPGEAIRQENIEKTLSMESPVYYSDAETKIGVFFQDSHRQYVPYKKLPEFFVKGLVASEDHDFSIIMVLILPVLPGHSLPTSRREGLFRAGVPLPSRQLKIFSSEKEDQLKPNSLSSSMP